VSDERAYALVLANKLLDQPYCDPDDDLRVLSRQLLRSEERCQAITGELAKNKEACLHVASTDLVLLMQLTEQRKKTDWLDEPCPVCGKPFGSHKAVSGWIGKGCPS
jgi:DNA repair exonuclease SbcCD ATPase subunit